MVITTKYDDFLLEKKKINAGLQAYLDKKAGKKSDKDDDDDKDDKKCKCKEKEEDDDDDKDDKDENDEKEGKKGLTDKQKKLPPALQKAILKRMNK